jgi:hypothetical protein
MTHLEEWILVLGLELVRPKELEMALGLGLGDTLLVALEEGKDVVEDDALEIDVDTGQIELKAEDLYDMDK